MELLAILMIVLTACRIGKRISRRRNQKRERRRNLVIIEHEDLKLLIREHSNRDDLTEDEWSELILIAEFADRRYTTLVGKIEWCSCEDAIRSFLRRLAYGNHRADGPEETLT